MINKDLVTVITMTYNHFDNIGDTIKSVLMQDYTNIEYIISDDGSSNFPEEYVNNIIANSMLNNIKILKNNFNVGTVKNANRACKLAKGKFILFLSCGDVFFDQSVVSAVVNRFNETSSDVIAVRRIAYIGDYNPICSLPHIQSIRKIYRLNTRDQQYDSFITMHSMNAFSGSALYYSKHILEKLNYFDEKYILWEDGPFIEKYLREYSINCSFDIVAIWYEMGGVSSKLKINKLLQQDCVLFDQTDRMIMKNKMKPFVYKNVKYIFERSNSNSLIKKTIVVFKYPFVFLSHLLYKFKEKLAFVYDRYYYKKHTVSKPNYIIMR